MVYVVTFLGKSNSKSYSIILFEIYRNFRIIVQSFTFKYLKEEWNFNRYVFKNISVYNVKVKTNSCKLSTRYHTDTNFEYWYQNTTFQEQ